MNDLLTSIHARDTDPVVLIQAGVLAPGSPEAKRRFAAKAQGFPGRADTMLIFGGRPQRMLADVQSKLRGRT